MTDELTRPPSVLIIDDDPALGKTLIAILKKANYEASWVTRGQDAILQVKNSSDKPDVALIDIKLPDMNGIEILRALKQIHPDIGAIMMTGHAEVETALEALNEGAFAYILKPYNVDEVKAIIARLVEKLDLVRENRQLLRRMLNLNAELEDKVRERTADLQETNLKLAGTIEGLKEADKLKSEFVTMVSHELRTPLTVIIGCTQTLVSQFNFLDRATILKYLQLIDSDAHRMTRLADEILELSQTERQSQKLKYEPVDLRELLKQMVERFSFADNSKHFRLDFKSEITVIQSDKDRLLQILNNLIGNAVKYTPAGGQIYIMVQVSNTEVLLSVIDSGPGIPADLREKVFEPFYRTQDAVNFKHPGAGLGLTITRALVQALGGRIWMDPNISSGCKISVTLPRDKALPDSKTAAA